MKKPLFLTTGAKSGIGRCIYEGIGGLGLTRENAENLFRRLKKTGVDVIIHAAFNSGREVTSENLYEYFYDNVILTEKLLEIPHKKFIFFSSVVVYPKTSVVHSEDEIIRLDDVSGIYGITKLMSEVLVKNRAKNFLILRPTSLLGKYSRKEGNLMRLLAGNKKTISLSLAKSSEMNYVSHSDVLDFIKLAVSRNLKGIYNIGSSKNITFGSAAKLTGKKVSYGKFRFKVGRYNTDKAAKIMPAFKKISKEVINRFIQEATL